MVKTGCAEIPVSDSSESWLRELKSSITASVLKGVIILLSHIMPL